MKKYTYEHYYCLKSNSTGVVNLPPEIWQSAKWDINEQVEVIVCEHFNKDGRWFSVSIEAVKDRVEGD